jgi:hypothetical protein
MASAGLVDPCVLYVVPIPASTTTEGLTQLFEQASTPLWSSRARAAAGPRPPADGAPACRSALPVPTCPRPPPACSMGS